VSLNSSRNTNNRIFICKTYFATSEFSISSDCLDCKLFECQLQFPHMLWFPFWLFSPVFLSLYVFSYLSPRLLPWLPPWLFSRVSYLPICFLLIHFLNCFIQLLYPCVVIGFWPSSRLRHVSHLLGASLLCEQAQLTYKSNMGPGRKPWAHGPKKKASGSPRAHIWSSITCPDPLLNRSCETLRTLIIGTRILPGATQGSDTKTFRACYSCTAYS